MNNMTEQNLESKVCGSCGGSFGCGARLDGCWCAEVKLPEATATTLNAQYTDCLCPKCLDMGVISGDDL